MTHIEKLLEEDGTELGLLPRMIVITAQAEQRARSRASLLIEAATKLRAFVPSPILKPKPRARKRPIKRIKFSQTIYVTPRGRLKPLCEFAMVDKTNKNKPYVSQFRHEVPRHVVGPDLNLFNRRCARMYRELIGRTPF